jgi:hypothetical protein
LAKPKVTTLFNLFEGHRRRARLEQWTHLITKAGESRIKLDLRLPLLNESVIGMNEAIGEAFTVMAKNDSKIDRTSLNVEMEGMTLEAFSTSEVKHVSVSSTGVKMVKLALVAAGEGEKRTVDLLLTAYVPASIQLRDWAWDHNHKEFHLEAIYSQSELEFSDEPDESDDDEPKEEDEDLDPDNEHDGPVAAPLPVRPAKNGPKQLAEEHAKQK